MNDEERALMTEAAVAAANALGRQQGMFGFGTIRPDRFSSNSYQNQADCRKHFAWVADANRWEDEQSRMALPTFLSAEFLAKLQACRPTSGRKSAVCFPDPTLARMLNDLDQQTMPFQTQAAVRAELVSLKSDAK